MRNLCVKLIQDKISVKNDEKIFFMTGDLGYSVLEGIAKKLEDSFLNVGIAEANMMSIAAAMGFEGRKVFTYSIVPFTTFRCLEQIRNDICYHMSDVTIIGVGVGYGYGYLGPTHHAIDDLGVMTAIANLEVYSPNDLRELEMLFPEIWNSKNPKYLRLGKGGERVIDLALTEMTDGAFVYGSRDAKLSVFVLGTVISEVDKALDPIFLMENNISKSDINVISIAKVKPFPAIRKIENYVANKVLLVEEVSSASGISGKLHREIADTKKNYFNFESLSAPDQFAKKVGGQDFLRKSANLDFLSIRKKIKQLLSLK